MKSITCKTSIDIVSSSTARDRNDAAEIVMQINFTQLKSEINASQSGKIKVLVI